MNLKPNILGIDPGLERTGWCIIPSQNQSIQAGIVITSSKDPIGIRLYNLQKQIEKIIEEKNIHLLSIEKIVITKKIESRLEQVLQARGVILSLAGKFQLRVQEIAPNTIKKAITGSGKANKTDIKNALRLIYKIEHQKDYTDDVYDAIAIALTCKNSLSYDF
jgi:crossover junction endodeoxyribonuclease RuvC